MKLGIGIRVNCDFFQRFFLIFCRALTIFHQRQFSPIEKLFQLDNNSACHLWNQITIIIIFMYMNVSNTIVGIAKLYIPAVVWLSQSNVKHFKNRFGERKKQQNERQSPKTKRSKKVKKKTKLKSLKKKQVIRKSFERRRVHICSNWNEFALNVRSHLH